MRGKLRFCVTVFFVLFFYNVPASVVDATIRIMPLGDSITKGSRSGVVPDDPAYYISYRKALWDKHVDAGYDVDFVGSLNSGSEIFGALEPADHEGHGGWRDDEIVSGRPGEGKLEDWLIAELPDIVLLHIGTNGLDASPDDVEDILDVIDNYESNSGKDVWVILARIINRNIYSPTITQFNDNVEDMAWDRMNNPNNPAYPDKIIIVDMEDGANINYDLVTDNPPGDMWDAEHPFQTGYEKMADVWFYALEAILPSKIVMTSAMVTGDLNGDGGSDMIGVDTSGKVWFTTDLSTWTDIPGQTLEKIKTGDLDGDGDDDIAGVDPSGGIMYTTDLSTWTDIPGQTLEKINTGDLDGDGDDDIVGVDASGGIWYTTDLSTWINVRGRLAEITTGDLDGDGDDDILGLNAIGKTWYTTDLGATWINVKGILAEITTGDLDGDGNDDILGINAIGKIWYTTDLSTWINIPGILAEITTGDLDGDGDDDIAGTNAIGKVWFTTNLNTWTNISVRTLEKITTGDLDGDGDDDIAGVNDMRRVWHTTDLSALINIPFP